MQFKQLRFTSGSDPPPVERARLWVASMMSSLLSELVKDRPNFASEPARPRLPTEVVDQRQNPY